MATAGDVPGLYDIVINVSGGNTTGFVFDDALESSLPFRTHKATYTYSPTFIERQNVQGDFGDNQQDFFLTATQKDWSLGEQQRYFRSTDEDSRRRYWSATAVDVREPGQVSMRFATSGISPGTIVAAGSSGADTGRIYLATSTNLKRVTAGGTISDLGVHGMGAAPTSFGLAADFNKLYLTSNIAGSVGVRSFAWASSTFATFSATPATTLCYLNNTLYGVNSLANTLIRFDTAGVATTLFTWKDSAGGSSGTGQAEVRLRAFGGKLLILRSLDRGGELWLYDGTSPTRIAELPFGFQVFDLEVAGGNAYVSGLLKSGDGSSTFYQPAVYYYAGGSIGLLWKTPTATSSTIVPSGLAAFNEGIVFGNPKDNTLLYYDIAQGGISTLGSHTSTGSTGSVIVACDTHFAASCLGSNNATTVYPVSPKPSSATFKTSLYDFESSLKKFMRGVTVEFDSATDGNGGTVDVAYRLEDVDGSYTSLATGVTSGTETTFSGITGKRISVQPTLNKGTSTNGPVVKRIMVRAAPILTRYGQNEYILSCIGDPASEDRQILRDGMSSHPLTGRAQADQLRLAAASTSPLTLTDRFRTYTGIIETLEIYEQHSSNADPSASGRFVVKVVTREI